VSFSAMVLIIVSSTDTGGKKGNVERLLQIHSPYTLIRNSKRANCMFNQDDNANICILKNNYDSVITH